LNLFIDAISNPWIIILFNDTRKIIDSLSWNIKWNESSTLIPKIDEFLTKNNLVYKELTNIVLVNWPWSFTWVRTITLVVNTINYITNNSLTDISYFDLFDCYPIIKSSSRRDSFFLLNSNSKIEIIYNDELVKLLESKWINKIYWETNSEVFNNLELLEKVDYENIIKKIEFNKLKQIEPLYIKKPNIS